MTEEESAANPDRSQVDFSGLILGFSSAALYYIGHSAVEGKSIRDKNFPLALQNIEIVELLRKKTLGNLSKEENELIDHIIIDLRAKYDKCIKQDKTKD